MPASTTSRFLRSPLILTVLCLCFAVAAFATGPQTHVVYTFPGQPNGIGPTSSLVADSAGNLYGTTANGGNSPNCIWSGGAQNGCGAVFEVSPPVSGTGSWTETVLYNFQDLSDGGLPYGGLVMDAAGNLYGAAAIGGNGLALLPGTIYELSPPAVSGGSWTFTKLYTFQSSSSTDGSGPYGNLIFDHSGNLYGTTYSGGASNKGTVFELSPPSVSRGAWTETVLHAFSGGDGWGPMAGLYMDSAGSLYGTTVYGGNFSVQACLTSGCGVAFKLSQGTGGVWTELLLHEFRFDIGTDGRYPYGGLTFHNGEFYGTISQASGSGGDVFQLTPGHGGPWVAKTIHTFNVASDGQNPYSGLIVDATGNLYGTTSAGGSANGQAGTVYKLTPPVSSSDPWTETILTNFAYPTSNGASDPIGGLLLKGGRLYGTTSGCQGQFYAGCGLSGGVFAITGF
jgi:uncharacterized repeat protein (TIGR03803 family)